MSAGIYGSITKEYIANLGFVRDTGAYQAGTYFLGDQALDNGWLGIANKETTDRLAPRTVGGKLYLYDGASPTNLQSGKIIRTGQRYVFNQSAIISGYRVYVVGGNTYNVSVTRDPLGTPIYSELVTLNPLETGWTTIQTPPTLIKNGDVLDLFLSAREPDPTPTTFSGNWDYSVPQNETVPLSGQITHSGKTPDSLNVHKTDNDAGDRSAELEALTVGDIITNSNFSWAIQVITDNGTWMEFIVAPASQTSIGVQNFDFETVTATPITYLEDSDYFLSNANISGLISIDNAVATVNNDAYGVDILVQDFETSDDWDIIAYTEELAGSVSEVSGNSLSGREYWVSYSDGTYTEASPLMLSAGVAVDLPNDGVKDTDVEFGPASSLYDPVTGRIAGITGRVISVTMFFKAKATTGTTPLVEVWQDIGEEGVSTIELPYRRISSFPKGNNVEREVSNTTKFYQRQTWEANGMKYRIEANTAVEIYDIGFNIFTASPE